MVLLKISPSLRKKKERKRTTQGGIKKERNKTDNPREGWEDGTPPPHKGGMEAPILAATFVPKKRLNFFGFKILFDRAR